MELIVKRIAFKDDYTIGKLYINGQYFSDVLEDCDRGLTQDMPSEEIKAKKIYGKTAIPKGTYMVDMNTVSPKFKDRSWAKPYGGKLPRLIGVKGFEGVLIHCLTPDTEILTEYGWQNLEDFKNNTPNNCYSYNTNTNKIELVNINHFIENEYDGDLYCCNGRRVNYEVTNKHKLFVGAKKHSQELYWSFKDADSITKQSYFLTSAIKDGGWEITTQQKLLYRIIMAVQSDGYILNWSKTASQVKFHFTKERKINRIKELVTQFGGSYTEYIDCEMKTHIALDNKTSEIITEIMNPNRCLRLYKELPMELLNLKPEDMKDLVFEYLFWDGRYENYLKNNKNIIISSTNTNTLDILQAMCTMSGLRSYKKRETYKKEKHNYCYDLVIYENQQVVTPEKYTYSTKKYNGIVWCISNDNHTIIIRKNGRTMIVGNCGNTPSDTSGCILPGKNSIKGQVINSTQTFAKLMTKFLLPAKVKGEAITITIT